MELNALNEKQLASLYREEMEYDFPQSELKPLGAMLRLLELGQYDPLVATENGETVGYAMVWLSKDRKGVLLDYLGVLRGKRNGGTGGKILALLLERYGHIFGEAEAPPATMRRRTSCAAAELASISATVSGCWTMGAPSSECISSACTADRRRMTGW